MRAIALLTSLLAVLACDDAATAESPRDTGPQVDMRSGDMTVGDASEPPLDMGVDAEAMPDAAVEPDAMPDAMPPDPTEAVFADDHLVVVSLEIDEADWDALRVQERGELDLRGAECLDAPFASPYTWFRARVTVDGQTYDDVGVRKKGFFGSVSSSKPSLKIRMNKFVDDQLHEGLSRITLNNQRQDPSILRSCLAYAVFERAGVPTPRCNFAQLFVNGRDMGVFAHVESLKKPWLRRHFADEDGHLYEGTLSDFRPEYRGTIEQKTDEDEPYTAPIDRISDAVQAPDDQLMARLDAVIDLDTFFRFWAAEVLTTHWDGYAGNTNNFWFYDDPTSGKVHFIPWGPDATFTEPILLFERQRAPWAVMATGIITRRLYAHPVGRARYLAEVERQLNEVWDPAWMQGLIATWTATFGGVIRPNQREAHTAAVQEVSDFVQEQAVRMRREIREPADWDVPLRDSLCSQPVGEIEATLETTWGTWPTRDAFGTGEGTFEARYGETQVGVVRVGAAIGPGQGGGLVLIQPIFTDEDAVLFVYMQLRAAQVRPGETPITRENACSFNVLDQRTGDTFPIAECPEGVLRFEEASMQAGAVVRGGYAVTLWGRPE